MLSLGLNAVEQGWYDAASLTNCMIKTRVEVWDLNHNPLNDVSDMFQSGQANDDTSADIKTSATLELFDPTFEAGFDDPSNLGASQPPNRMIHATRGLFVPEMGKYVFCPTFTGHVSKIDRDDNGDVLKLECQSKEARAMRNLWTPYVVKDNTNKLTAIRKIMADTRGETHFNLGSTTAKLSSTLSLGIDISPWAACTDIARSMGRVLFYDARGVLHCRIPEKHHSWTFRTGPGGNMATLPQRGYNPDGVVNAVRFTGGTPKGKKHPVTAHAVAPASYSSSPGALATNDVPDHMWTAISADDVKSHKEAQKRADDARDKAMLDSVELAFDGIMYGRLEAGDVIRVHTDSLLIDLRYRTGSRPFGLGVASYGYTARVSEPVRKLRSK